jgi:hypothetical protein
MLDRTEPGGRRVVEEDIGAGSRHRRDFHCDDETTMSIFTVYRLVVGSVTVSLSTLSESFRSRSKVGIKGNRAPATVFVCFLHFE